MLLGANSTPLYNKWQTKLGLLRRSSKRIHVEILAHQVRKSLSYIIVGNNINNLLSDFDPRAKDVMDNITPLRTIIIKCDSILPWYNHYINIARQWQKTVETFNQKFRPRVA